MIKFLIHIGCFLSVVAIGIAIVLALPQDLKPLGYIASVILGVIGNIVAKLLSEIFE